MDGNNANINASADVDKKFLVGAVVLFVLIAAVCGYWYYKRVYEAAAPNAIEQAGDAAEDLGKRASQGVLPSIDPGSNPMKNAPDINPTSKTNPFSDIKTNPF